MSINTWRIYIAIIRVNPNSLSVISFENMLKLLRFFLTSKSLAPACLIGDEYLQIASYEDTEFVSDLSVTMSISQS